MNLNLKTKESAEYFDIYSAQGHVMARIPKGIPDLPMTISMFSHSLLYLAVIRLYALSEPPGLKEFAQESLAHTMEVEQKYAAAFNN